MTECIPFLKKGLTRQLNQRDIEEEANKLWLPLFLITNGIPERMVSQATADQLAVLEEIVVRKKTSDKQVSDAIVTQIGFTNAMTEKKN